MGCREFPACIPYGSLDRQDAAGAWCGWMALDSLPGMEVPPLRIHLAGVTGRQKPLNHAPFLHLRVLCYCTSLPVEGHRI